MASERVSANSRNRRPTIPPIRRIGRNTAINEMLIDSTVNPTSRAPASAASTRPLPASAWRDIFSSTTIASSTTKPVAIVRAISDKLFKLKFRRYIAAKVPTIETSTATLGMIAARISRRNKKTISVTKRTAMTKVHSVSCNEARIVMLRSEAGKNSISLGIAAWRCGNSALTRSTVSMMLAPG